MPHLQLPNFSVFFLTSIMPSGVHKVIVLKKPECAVNISYLIIILAAFSWVFSHESRDDLKCFIHNTVKYSNESLISVII